MEIKYECNECHQPLDTWSETHDGGALVVVKVHTCSKCNFDLDVGIRQEINAEVKSKVERIKYNLQFAGTLLLRIEEVFE